MDRRVSVVIVNYNSGHLVRKCIQSLRGEPVSTIIVYDNCSDLANPRAAAELESLDTRITVVRGSENIGFGGGANAGVGEADLRDRDLVWILNPDTEVVPGALCALIAAMDEGEMEIASPLIVDYSGRVWFAGGDIDVSTGRSTHRSIGCRPEIVDRGVTAIGFTTGAAPVFTGAAWRRLGGFRDDLFMYWEDVDLSLRATELGITMWLVPSAMVQHLEGGSSGERNGKSELYYYYVNRNRFIACSRYTSRWSLALGAGLMQTIRMQLSVLKYERAGRVRKLSAVLRGQKDGLVHAVVN